MPFRVTRPIQDLELRLGTEIIDNTKNTFKRKYPYVRMDSRSNNVGYGENAKMIGGKSYLFGLWRDQLLSRNFILACESSPLFFFF